MFGVTTYSGDRRTVNAALDLRQNVADMHTLASDRQEFLDDAHGKLQEASALVDKHRGLRLAAEAHLKDAHGRLTKAKRALSSMEDVATANLRDAEELGDGTRSKDRAAGTERNASAPDREAHAEASARAGEAEARMAMCAVITDALVEALRGVAPGHALLAPAPVGYADGSPRIGIDVVFDEAADDVLLAHGLPTHASTLADPG